jgi:methionine-gamma-lyase
MKRFRTRAVHSGQHPDQETGAHATPIYSTSTFALGSFERSARLFSDEEKGNIYGRTANPTTKAFENKLADLEGAEAAIALSSGMGAISALMLSLLQPGDEVVYLAPLYGGTEAFFFESLNKFGIATTDAISVENLEATLSPATRLIYLETPTNPNLRIYDLAAIAAIAKARGILTAVDNTFATPYLTRPLEHGIDLVLHSATKYIGGHGDTLGGVLAGPLEIINKVRVEGLRHGGATLGAFEAFLLMRGLKTLPLRMEAHCAGALQVAQFLKNHPAVKKVHYPGLPEHPGHAVAERQMLAFGGMVSLDLGSKEAAGKFLNSLGLFVQAVSLGDVDSLASHPASTTHNGLPAELLKRHGVTEGLVRLSIGIEDPEDLVEDLQQALDKATAMAIA